MTKHKNVLQILSLIMLMACVAKPVFAAEYEKDLGRSPLSNKIRCAYPDVFEKNLRAIRKVAVLINSASLLGGVAEEQLILELKNNGYEVVDRSKVSDLMRKEVFKEEIKALEEQLELEKQWGREDSKVKDQRILEKRIEQLRQGNGRIEKDIVNLIDIGRNLALDAVFTGTLFEGRRQIAFNEDNKPLSMDKPVVSTFHLQVIDMKSASVIAIIMSEYDKGENVTDSVHQMIEKIKEITKR